MIDESIKVAPVILSGGSGTRLWPVSRGLLPKQFISMPNETHSFFQQTIKRFENLSLKNNFIIKPPLVVANEDHRFIILEQLRELKIDAYSLILEPSPKNTAPALTLAALESIKNGDDPILVVAPSDHLIKNINSYQNIIKQGIDIALNGTIVTFGIKPTYPSSGFGYIKCSDSNSKAINFDVEKFVEKPSEKFAKELFDSGNYFWNSGIYIMRASVWIDAINKFKRDIYKLTLNSFNKKTIDNFFIRPEKVSFEKIVPNSIDYSVIENCPGTKFDINMIILDTGWDDLGSWDSFWKVSKKDKDDNVAYGDVLINDTKNSLIYSSNRFICTSGVNDLIIIETADTVLITKRNQGQKIKEIVGQLKLKKRHETELNKKIYRPWGWFDTLEVGNNFKVKRICVNAHSKLSLQKHLKRAEHWVVVKGKADIICGDNKSTLHENQSTYIPMNTIHRLSNTTNQHLEIIEIQSGNYLEEDDIIRYEDDYDRN